MNQKRRRSPIKTVSTTGKSMEECLTFTTSNKDEEKQVKIHSNCTKVAGKTRLNNQVAQALNKQLLEDKQVVNYYQDKYYLLHTQNKKINQENNQLVRTEESFEENFPRLTSLASFKKEAKNGSSLNNSELKKDNSNNPDERDVDSGYAWIILAVMFIINASAFGTARAYGLIFEKLAREHDNARAEAALPFNIMGICEGLGGPLTGYLLTKTNSWRFTVCFGSLILCVAHILAAFCTTLNSLILTMGLMSGIGLSFITISSFQINNAYFDRYKSRAFGVGLSGAALGSAFISPICQYVLKNSATTSECYLMLGFILFPNILLSLLLKPKISKRNSLAAYEDKEGKKATVSDKKLETVSGQVTQLQIYEQQVKKESIWCNIIKVLQTPFFHLIWPTQLLFCWLNFVFGMILVDFGKDRGLDCQHGAHLIPIWACGQLIGRVFLGSLVDLKLISYKLFTVICFTCISLSTWILNNIRPANHQYQDLLISIFVFILSMFISNLYILFNGLILNYMEKSLTPLSYGISSFISSFFLLPRANVIGYYRDIIGNYDSMLTLFTYISLIAAIIWLLIPELIERFKENGKKYYNYKHFIHKWFKSYSLSSTAVFLNISLYKLPQSNDPLS